MRDAGEPMRFAIARAIGRWDDSKELALVAPVACVILEAVFLTRYISFLPPDYDPVSVWLLVGCVAAILACVFLRRRCPLAATLAACACAVVSAHVDEGAYTGVPLLVLMYGMVARRNHLKAAASVLAVIAAFWAPVHLAGNENLALVHLELVLAVVVAALVSRALWTRRRAARELEGERAARERVARERDEAEARSRIAGELHDSVGHDLTAIIALSEGLMGATGDETLDAAVASINDLARAGLSDTRRAVRQLSALHGGAAGAGRSDLHVWDDALPVLEHARSAGLAVAFTETGSRSPDREQAELAFSATREGRPAPARSPSATTALRSRGPVMRERGSRAWAGASRGQAGRSTPRRLPTEAGRSGHLSRASIRLLIPGRPKAHERPHQRANRRRPSGNATRVRPCASP